MEISEMTVNTFWKGEYGVKGIVRDRDQEYKVTLNVKNQKVYDYTCNLSSRERKEGALPVFSVQDKERMNGSCEGTGSYKGMCVHAQALWEYYQEQLKNHSGKLISTSQEARIMIREYTNHEVARIIQDSEEQQVRLVPRILMRDQDIRLECRIGRERLYIIKDLIAFTQAIEEGTLVSYGKQLQFHHSLRSFVKEDRELAAFLVELVNVYQEHFRQFQRSSYATIQELREIHLSKANTDRFFQLMKGKELEIEDQKGNSFTVKLKEQLRPIDLKIRKAGRDGISVTVPQELYVFSGEEHLYLGNPTELCCMDRKATEALGIFLAQILTKKGSHQVELQERDIPLFLERVLKKILPYCNMDHEGVELESYRPEELKAVFTFDSTAPQEIIMLPELSYGDYTFVPMEDEKVPRSICRNIPAEFRISQVITKYFRFKGTDQKTLIIREDDNALYQLLKYGISEFMELGEVHVSDRASHVRIMSPSKIEIGVHAADGWLKLNIDAEGLNREELAEVLAEYDPKKPYYRLKNGEFLQLDEGGLLTIAQLVQGLALTKKELSGDEIRIPGYRALYLDSVLKEDNGISFYRDHLYRSVVRGMKSVEDSEYELPDQLKPVLRLYQRTGFRWLRTLDHYGFGGILADDMGLGKTIQIIALLLDEKERQEERRQSLIICPSSLVYNWENEIHRFAPEMLVKTVAGAAEERENLFNKLQKWQLAWKNNTAEKMDDEIPDVLITSYELLKRDILWYKDLNFRYEVIDEAQYIKNPATQSARAVKTIHAQTRFALTGTPIENRLSELWSIFDYLMPGFLFSYARFKQCFELPIAREKDELALRQLKRMIGPFIMRRLKKDVLRDLPAKLETVIYSRASEKQKQLYTAYALQLKEELETMESGRFSGERMQILAELMRLRQICCDPGLCFERYKGESAKLETLMELLASAIAGGHKILVFSQFTRMLDIIASRLKKENISYYMLTGSTPKEERIHLAGAFQNDDVPVFLISLKAGGTGLNLTAADIVVHYDPWWNVAAQNQASDRTHRIGQEKQVTVYQLIMKDTIEENIRDLQEQKRALAEQIISEGTVSVSSLTREDMIQILGV